MILGHFAFAVLDPITLSIKKLKQLLDDRGISYAGVVEKQELVELVQASGTPTSEEVMESETVDEEDSVTSTQFTYPPLLPDKTWKDVRLKVSEFGIRTGVFKCSLDKRLCNRKNWTSSRLILALPQGNKAKEDVILHSYQLPSTSMTVLQWVRKHLSSRIKRNNL
ncbi:e3 ubiquitin-protein ligase RNF103 [Caerostris extrusa]|uniref:E3 ubiquitin-protein ligase RNF103 n=1 Tax=Caerostris extrusa TaxID=172846 RepID=A0AAV4QFN8_CAEEX|nr:e3 ubiquitin-protein ligase RNF103 [Caerostris extrusa]